MSEHFDYLYKEDPYKEHAVPTGFYQCKDERKFVEKYGLESEIEKDRKKEKHQQSKSESGLSEFLGALIPSSRKKSKR